MTAEQQITETPAPAGDDQPEHEETTHREHSGDDSEARGGIPVAHLAVGGATGGTVGLGVLYQLTGVPGLVAGGALATAGTVAYVRHRYGRRSTGASWSLGSSWLGSTSQRSGSHRTSALFSPGRSTGSQSGRSWLRGGGADGGRRAARQAGRVRGAASSAGQSAPSAVRADRTGRRSAGTDSRNRRMASQGGPIRQATARVRQAATSTASTARTAAHGTKTAAQGVARAARQAAGWVDRATGGRAGRAVMAAGRAARKAAIYADRATGRRVSTAYRAATTGKDRSFRARRRRAAAVLGWHGPVTGPIVALVSVLVEAWRRRKARKKAAAETAEGAAAETSNSETTAEETAETGSQDTPANETPKSQIFDEPTTATCSRCGRTHTVTLADDEIERIVTCPCGHRIRFYRDPGAFDPPEDTTSTASTSQDRRRPHTAPTSTYTRRTRTMSANPLAAAAAELNAVAAAHAPADMWQVAREMDQLHEIPANVGMALRTYTVRLQGEYPIHPSVVEALGELYMAHAALVERAQAIGALFRTVHADDLKREESPRINEHAWNV